LEPGQFTLTATGQACYIDDTKIGEFA